MDPLTGLMRGVGNLVPSRLASPECLQMIFTTVAVASLVATRLFPNIAALLTAYAGLSYACGVLVRRYSSNEQSLQELRVKTQQLAGGQQTLVNETSSLEGVLKEMDKKTRIQAELRAATRSEQPQSSVQSSDIAAIEKIEEGLRISEQGLRSSEELTSQILKDLEAALLADEEARGQTVNPPACPSSKSEGFDERAVQ